MGNGCDREQREAKLSKMGVAKAIKLCVSASHHGIRNQLVLWGESDKKALIQFLAQQQQQLTKLPCEVIDLIVTVAATAVRVKSNEKPLLIFRSFKVLPFSFCGSISSSVL